MPVPKDGIPITPLWSGCCLSGMTWFRNKKKNTHGSTMRDFPPSERGEAGVFFPKVRMDGKE